MKTAFYFCEHCGNIVAMIRDRGVPVVCCGEKMKQMEPGKTDASKEKHVPVYQLKENLVSVTVGSAEHPMSREHYIEWICIETEQGMQQKHLSPDMPPKACFALCEGDAVEAVYAFCNLHSLWKVSVKE